MPDRRIHGIVTDLLHVYCILQPQRSKGEAWLGTRSIMIYW